MLGALIWAFLVILSCVNIATFVFGHSGLTASKNEDFFRFQTLYLIATGLFMLADWLQGPYLYRLYEHYGYPKVKFVDSKFDLTHLGAYCSLLCCRISFFSLSWTTFRSHG